MVNQNPGSPQNNFMPNLLSGQFMHMGRPRQRTKPVYEAKKVIESGNNFSQAKIYVHSPTLQFPTTGIFFQLSNAKGSCFMRFNNSSELTSLAEWLIEASSQVEVTVTNMLPLEQQVNAQLNQYTDLVSSMKMMNGMNLNAEEGIEE